MDESPSCDEQLGFITESKEEYYHVSCKLCCNVDINIEAKGTINDRARYAQKQPPKPRCLFAFSLFL